MSIYTDPSVVQAEIDRRFELAGVDPFVRDPHHGSHVRDLPIRPLGAHPLAAFFARLVGGRTAPAPTRSRRGTTVVAGRPLHQ
ncbi:MAG TPA: hypothetical protein VES93_04160 [Ornithinibacter sp.]|nr:hypothetical protein [Ornithinibacter sp.]